jgi:hypothetical protein
MGSAANSALGGGANAQLPVQVGSWSNFLTGGWLGTPSTPITPPAPASPLPLPRAWPLAWVQAEGWTSNSLIVTIVLWRGVGSIDF